VAGGQRGEEYGDYNGGNAWHSGCYFGFQCTRVLRRGAGTWIIMQRFCHGSSNLKSKIICHCILSEYWLLKK
jgi:hypothetical protein